MLATFGVDVGSEATDIYPYSVCNNCYSAMKRIQSSKESGVVLRSQLQLSSWLPHSDESCPVCDGRSSDSNGKPSGPGIGRPRNDDIMHLGREVMRAVNKINPPKYSNLSLERSQYQSSLVFFAKVAIVFPTDLSNCSPVTTSFACHAFPR